MTELKKVTIVTAGSRGDIQPHLALAIVLKEKGYIVRFVTNANFQRLIESYEIGFCSIFPDMEQALRDSKKLMQTMYDGDTVTLMAGLADAFAEWAPDAVRLCQEEFKEHRPDLIIKGSLVDFLVYQAALNEKIPFADVALQILAHNPNHCLFGFPTLPFGLHKMFTRYFVAWSYYDGQMNYDKALQQMNTDDDIVTVSNRYSKSRFSAHAECPILPRLFVVPALIQPILYPCVKEYVNLKFVGYSIIPQAKQISSKKDDDAFGGSTTKQRLEEFLSRSNKDDCVYIGWGSMVSRSPQYMAEFAVRALRQCGQRGIILSGYGRLSLDRLQENQNVDKSLLQYAMENVIFVDSAPHEWLFRRVRATVHHGGAGTTAAALRSGKPTVVTPVLFDQWDNAYLVNQLQCGYGFEKTQLQSLTWQELGDTIHRVLSDSKITERARELGKELENQNGAETAASEVERYWKEYIETGIFWELFPGPNDSYTWGSSRRSFLRLVAVGAAAAIGGWFLYSLDGYGLDL